ncbi:hypothetical protein Tco_0590658 [Tanacetum coccineum]
MLKICPKLPGQIFEEPPLKEEILSFIRDLGHTGEIKFLSDVNVNHMHQPWRSFAAIINKCLSGKNTALESLRLSLIVDYFMAKDQAIPRRNKMFWHYARDDFMFTTIRVISKHQDTQVYDALLPQHLTNQAMLESEAYMTYHAYATGKRIKTIVKGDKPAKKKQYVTKSKGLTVLSEVALTEAEQIKLATKRSLIQTHGSHAELVSEEEDDNEVNVSKDNDDDADDDDDVDKDDEDEDDDNQDDDDEQTDSDNDGDDFVHPKLTTHDDEARQDDEEKEIDEEATHEEDEANELYRDVNINLEGRDTMMTDSSLPNVQGTQVTEDTHVIITTPVNPEGQQQSSSVSSGFVSNVQGTQVTEDTHVIITTPVNPEGQQQSSSVSSGFVSNMHNPSPDTLPSPATVPSSSLQDLPKFGSLFGFNHRLKTLETDFSEFKQTNQFADTVSSIPDIVDAYLANKMK